MLFKDLSLLFAAALAAAPASAAAIDIRSTPSSSANGYLLFNATQIARLNSLFLEQIKNDIFSHPPQAQTAGSQQTHTTSQDNIVKYARYAGAAYKLEGPSWDCESNCQSQDTKGTIVDYYWDNIVYPSTGFVAHKDDTKEIIVSFRGSTVLFDWLADAQLLTLNWPESVPGSKVHSGFLAAFNSASDKIKSTIETILKQHPDYSIVITGHSLGGSEASIAAADFAVTHPEWKSKMALYTYGQPRTGNDVYANWLSSQPFPIYRATYKGDVVPQVPFRAMGFQHHGQEVHTSLLGSTTFCGPNPESSSCQDGVWTIMLNPIEHLLYPGLDYSLVSWIKANIKWALQV